jgi:hypothetical protein
VPVLSGRALGKGQGREGVQRWGNGGGNQILLLRSPGNFFVLVEKNFGQKFQPRAQVRGNSFVVVVPGIEVVIMVDVPGLGGLCEGD